MFPLTPYPLTPIGSFIGIVFSVLPLVSHFGFQSWNAVIWVYAFWIGSMNVVNFVDTIVWHDNVEIVIPVWCDIVTKFQTGAAIGVPACALVLCLHLFRITRMRAVAPLDEKAQRRCTLIFDLTLTLGVPFCVMALWIIVQPYRFFIYEEIGCQYVGYSYLSYFLFYMPQLIVVVATTVVTPSIASKLIRHRREMEEIISHYSDQEVAPSIYIRVLIISCLILLLNLPDVIVLILQLAMRIAEGSSSLWNVPYHSWAWVHGDGSISDIIQIPASIWGTFKWQVFSIKWNEWVYVLHALVFFAIFGTTMEARRRYAAAVHCVLVVIKLKCSEKAPKNDTSAIIFSSNPQRPARLKRGTFSFLASSNGTARQTINITSSTGPVEDSRTSCAHRLPANTPDDRIDADTLEETPAEGTASN